jgi:hypothetical protein
MISLPATEQMGGSSTPNLADALFGIGSQAAKISRILDYADYCGIHLGIECWTLRKPIPGYPKGSTVARQTLESYLFPASAGKYGSTPVSGASENFKAVETPGKGTP